MVLNDESLELCSRASLLGRCCSSEAANTNVLTWWQELGNAALGIEVALRDRHSHTLNSGVSKVARASASGVCEAVVNDSTSGAEEIGVEPCHLSVQFHFAFVDEIINNAPHQRNLLVVARELCACHCRVTQVNELAPEIYHVLMTFNRYSRRLRSFSMPPFALKKKVRP